MGSKILGGSADPPDPPLTWPLKDYKRLWRTLEQIEILWKTKKRLQKTENITKDYKTRDWHFEQAKQKLEGGRLQ